MAWGLLVNCKSLAYSLGLFSTSSYSLGLHPPHGRPVPTTAWSHICPPRHTVTCEHAAFLSSLPSPGEPTPFLGVAEWPGAHLEPADQKDSRHSKWPQGPGCDLAEDTAPGAPAPQGRDLRLCLWDLAEGRNTIMDAVQLDSVGFCKSSVLARGQLCWMLAVPGKGSDEVQILEMPSKTSVCTLKPEADAKPGMPMCLGLWQANSSPRPLLLAGYEDGSVTLWDISERKVCSRIACHEEPVMGLDFDSQKAKGVSGSAGKVLAVWSLDSQQSLQFLFLCCV
nr:guanine nucleotide-binding protein subunit beta-like protein 1 isoform X3 [Peromyscus maniculatus bairdii]